VEPSYDIPYARQMQPGERYAPLRFRISADVNEQYLFALGDYARRYLGASDARAQVHPVLLLHMSARTHLQGVIPDFDLDATIGFSHA
jgi:hypothetical protein